MVGTKTLKYGTALMPSIVKGIVGSFPGTLDACLSSEEQYRRFFNVPIEVDVFKWFGVYFSLRSLTSFCH